MNLGKHKKAKSMKVANNLFERVEMHNRIRDCQVSIESFNGACGGRIAGKKIRFSEDIQIFFQVEFMAAPRAAE